MQLSLQFPESSHILLSAEDTLFRNVPYTFSLTRILITNYHRSCHALIAVRAFSPGRPKNTLKTCRAIYDCFCVTVPPQLKFEAHSCVCLQ